MKISKHHGTYNRTWRYDDIRYIVIHYTATTAPALNNCRYFAGGDRGASADYFVDDSGIWEYNDPAEGFYTWAVGDGCGAYGITNQNSINVEVVNAGGAFSEAEIGHLCELVPYLMERFGVPASRVVRHYDASRKACPAGYVDQAAWNALHARITTGGQMARWIEDGGRWWYRHADGGYTRGAWEKIDGLWYLFDSEGWMLTGWQSWKGRWYYLQPKSTKDFKEGQMREGWAEVDGAWYYLDPDAGGAMVAAECRKLGGEWYAFAKDGRMKTSVGVKASGALKL